MDSNTGSELVVQIAWLSAMVAALASALILAIALVVRARQRREEQLRDAVIAAWRPLFARIALEEGAPPALPPLRRRELSHLLEEWNALHDSLKGEATGRLNALAGRFGFDVVARRQLNSGNVSHRILAIRTLGHLRDASSWKALQEQLVSDNALVSFYAAAALVAIDAPRAMPGIMRELSERESWPGEAMARLLVDAGAAIAREPVRALMLALLPDKAPPLLPWLAHVDAILGSEVAIELLRRNPRHDGIVAAALLVVQDPALLPELAPYADAPNALVREHLAEAVGRLGGIEEIALMARLMADRVWWVRYRAAQGLLKLKGMDGERLETVRAEVTDAYARDMLRQAIAEAELP
ncbi:MAG: HEAT repeat domain-containing protein [Gammaproteobacteria bacterium]